MSDELQAGVIGVGSMGQHHARVYSELPKTTLAGVMDTDAEKGLSVATDYGGTYMNQRDLLDTVDVASVAVPTRFHADAVEACIEADVDVLVEKPYVDDRERGRELARRAREAGVTLQVGHIERFNPAVTVLSDIVPDLDVVSVDIDRLGPPLTRETDDNVVMDLMIHDIDILLSLVDSEIESLSAVARDDRHATAQFEFDSGAVSTVTASRLTQQKVRTLSITAESCRVNVDMIGQTVEIHRRSLPEYVENDGDIRYRHESVVERPMVENGEPLKAELASFVDAAQNGTEPLVTAENALDVLEVVERVEGMAFPPVPEVTRA